MKNALKSALIITLFSFSGQLVLFIVQIIAAAFFGANHEMDAYLAANTLPQYIISVLLGSLGFVFIPVFIDYKTKGVTEQAYTLAASLFNNCLLILATLSILGIVFAKPLVSITAPGLNEETLTLAAKVAIIIWPTILATGTISLLSSIYQAERKFGWPAAVPFIGALLNLALLLLLGRSIGVIGFALATTFSVLIQAILLLRIIAGPSRYKFSLNWNDPGIKQVFRLVLPLIVVAIITKFTPLIERYLASQLQEGSISHLNYAFKIAAAITILISIGGSTVIFPKMASTTSNNDMEGLRSTISLGLRIMWMIIAPVITIGFLLSPHVVKILFERGEFTPADTIIVSDIFRIYLIALIGMCMGNITGKGFYVLKDTRTLAIFGTIEAVAYAIYTILLTRWLGISGIAIGYVIYFNVSLLWQLLILNHRMVKAKGIEILASFGKTSVGAIVGSLITYLTILGIPSENSFLALIIGGLAGLCGYVVYMIVAGSPEAKTIMEVILKTKPQ